jgi:hypothetical protein
LLALSVETETAFDGEDCEPDSEEVAAGGVSARTNNGTVEKVQTATAQTTI